VFTRVLVGRVANGLGEESIIHSLISDDSPSIPRKASAKIPLLVPESPLAAENRCEFPTVLTYSARLRDRRALEHAERRRTILFILLTMIGSQQSPVLFSLDSSARLREPKPPRGLVLSTGEDIPRGQSVRARLLILELAKGAIKPGALTKCQQDAHAGLYAEAMGGFVQWMAGRYEGVRATFHRRVSEYRNRALDNVAHARTPDIVASLQAGFESYLDFGVASRALEHSERDHLASRCWDALRVAAAAQGKHQSATEPTARFLALLRSLITAGRAHLAARNGSEPDRDPGCCGWRRDNYGKWAPLGDCIGWVEVDDLYLEPTATLRAVQMAGRDLGEVLTISEQTLNKRLHERRLLASIDRKRETLTVRRSIGGSSKDVLHFLRNTVLPKALEDEVDDVG